MPQSTIEIPFAGIDELPTAGREPALLNLSGEADPVR
jgi:hypothetical protein